MKVEAFKHIKHYLENVNKKYGFVFSWIGLRKSDYTVFPLISSKENEDYLKYVKLRWDDSRENKREAKLSADNIRR